MKDFLEILSTTPNFTFAKDVNEETKLREEVYAAFEQVTNHLSLADKFQLYDLIDQLKMCETEYRSTIKQEFLELCLKGNNLQEYFDWHEERRNVRDFRNRWN